jgi:hypothetical protein
MCNQIGVVVDRSKDLGRERVEPLGELLVMTLLVGTKVRFLEKHRSPQVRRGAVGVIVDMEERITPHGPKAWVRARFGDFITPWIEAWQLEPVS